LTRYDSGAGYGSLPSVQIPGFPDVPLHVEVQFAD